MQHFSRPMIVLFLGLSIFCMTTVGCATATRGTTQAVSVSSTPQGARVIADGEYMGKTPVTMQLKRGKDHSIVIGGEIYEPVTVSVRKQFNSAIAGNVLLGGIIGIGVDAISGASFDLVPASIHVPLERKQLAIREEYDSLPHE